MEGVDPKAFEFALARIEDGFVFEKFGQDFLAKLLTYSFVPVGGLKDRGIDGFEHTFHRTGYERGIYQLSIEQDPVGKLRRSLQKLRENNISFDQFYFVTNQSFPDKDKAVDEFYGEFGKPVIIYDVDWFTARVNNNAGTQLAYHTFVESYLHEFNKPGKSYVVGDLINDPRLFVFLRQQWDEKRKDLGLDKILADTLILYALEDTDPDAGRLKSKEEIRSDIAKLIKFEPKLINTLIDQRLDVLTQRPRRVNYHNSVDKYCLPYETRLEIQNRNLRDAAIYASFRAGLEAKLKGYLAEADVRVSDCAGLMEAAINQLFYQQGLEFTNFVLHGENNAAFEKRLPDILAKTVDESSVVLKNKEAVKNALLITVRDIVYNGSRDEKEFLRRLSNTYMMLFLLQCDPKLATFFTGMASKLNVYVCTSILIPALSEIYLEPYNQRHWNLLKGAYNAGAKLIVNETIIGELAGHFRMFKERYAEFYEAHEELYLGDELQILYIPDIMIRAYFYAKMRGHVGTFDQFLDRFVTPTLDHAEDELTEWLKEEFGIRFVTDASVGVQLEAGEEASLQEKLRDAKHSQRKAQNDARVILTIYALRKMRNESDAAGIFGFQTWWLSKDTSTQRAVIEVFKDKYRVSCYIRPDFLYNYISLSPTQSDVDAVYQELFPSLLGVNISFHLPAEVTTFVQEKTREHAGKNPARLKAILRQLAERLKVDPNCRTRAYVKSYFDDRLKELTH